jgi:hypothetical protein
MSYEMLTVGLVEELLPYDYNHNYLLNHGYQEIITNLQSMI